ncbi:MULTISPECIES: tRNA 5-methoxyuridine(34)/uridine 5-oxyacetic acid(34) synthase CmoB [Halobacteriovorax]|uniref:tRNA 5-methoxyuridine(34)/uridine 5-oxyacetic acid(34) synthase CmoB n=1 Tax=Halobacteriovorax vibrionivorans TaxID=2152716 RepID=A0ABY0IHB1_9BACT|nr:MULTISPECIES: tRNA 5-methoxyuridine(34)/uridine 5-oxyacetic acid(34) synthase CmoB [Halobacteriovorax]RZF22333.1 tRNA 5-methoxyuridine(34)/uridine 5-oxyacetic acid(34) synthase CmoB [Halobacteriovorax vibrionivorans]TGD48585.1 tRNA 5-methoxyuridine(34)/uridine 5-oxyacetic acid(34) synthase CmoB [Halobacteriovorax sp. Y22]
MDNLEYLEKFGNRVDIESLRELKKAKLHEFRTKYQKEYKAIFDRIPSLKLNSTETIETAKELIPWRKGPFQIGELDIDAEWRSDKKWERLKESLPDLKDKVVLDVGCNNGYYMFEMAKQDPKLVIGIDPVMHNQAQFDFINHFKGHDNLKFELFGIEDLPNFRSFYDVIFSMGVLYHHRHPLEQLISIREALVPGGEMIMETIGIPGEDSTCLFPEDRYSKMRNVWFLPTLTCLKNWINRTGFIDIEVVSVSTTNFEEQRKTPWCPPPHQSLEDFLDDNDKSKTVEGYPAPVRFCIKAKKKPTSPIKTF